MFIVEHRMCYPKVVGSDPTSDKVAFSQDGTLRELA